MRHVSSSTRNAESTSTPTISSASWRRVGDSATESELGAYLRDTAATQTIQNAMSLAVAAMRVGPGGRVLDVGCGPGVFLPKLSEAVGSAGTIAALDNVAGFLVQARDLAAANRLVAPIDYVTADAQALPFADASFDACHTERVLIHLDDPDRCLREMRRVVKPSGWVVCVEPDLDGMRIDHAEPSVARVIVAGFTETIRNPAMGLELNRRMAKIGLIDRLVMPLTEVERELADDAAAYLRAGALRLADEGRATTEAVERGIEWLNQQAEAGAYSSYSTMFVVAGRVP